MLVALAIGFVVTGLLTRSAVRAEEAVPVAAPAQALSSSWFCAGATDDHLGAGADRGVAPGAVVIANSGSAAATGVVTLVPSVGSQVQIPVSVGADGQTVINEDVPAGAAWIGAIVDINAGGVAVEQRIDGSLGETSAPSAGPLANGGGDDDKMSSNVAEIGAP